MIIKLNKMFRDWNSNKFRVLEKEIINPLGVII